MALELAGEWTSHWVLRLGFILYIASFIAILLVTFGLTAEQALEEVIELSTSVLEIRGIDSWARTTALKEYIAKLINEHQIEGNSLLMESNERSNGCKL